MVSGHIRHEHEMSAIQASYKCTNTVFMLMSGSEWSRCRTTRTQLIPAVGFSAI